MTPCSSESDTTSHCCRAPLENELFRSDLDTKFFALSNDLFIFCRIKGAETTRRTPATARMATQAWLQWLCRMTT